MSDAPAAGRPSLTAIVLAFDEEVHIARCLRRLRPIAARIVVVDSFSSDRTVAIARAEGAEVLQRAWKNYADQFQWALDTVRPSTDWVMRIDCDEYLEPPLLQALARTLPTLPPEVTGLDLRRKVIFRGRFIRHGGYYPVWITRLWRPGAGRVEQRWMDEHIVLGSGRTERLSGGDLVDENLKDIGWWTDKHNRYATRQMVDFINLEHPLFPIDRAVEGGSSRQARRQRFLRNRVYAGAPLYARAALYFLQRYLLRLGFLDGRQGFVWHFLQGFWFFVLMDAKIDEARGFIRAHGVDAFRDRLRDHYGLEV